MELRDYVRILRAHWLGIVLLTLLGVAVAWGWSAVQPRVYTAETSGIVRAASAGSDTGSSLVGDQLARAKVTSYIDMGSWRSVAEYAIADLGLDTTPEALVNRVDVSNPLDTVIIHVSADAGSPEEARDLAESWMRGMVAQIDAVEGDGTEGSAAVTLVPGDSARLPTAPSSPNVRLSLALGGLVGLALGVGYAVIRAVLDRRVRDPRDIERETGASVVGQLPVDKDLAGGRRVLSFGQSATGTSPIAEALRELRTNLQFMDVDSPPRTIVVTSPLPGDGKSTLSSNLAMSLAAAGQHVVLLDADLRRPRIAEVFGLPEGAGLTDILSGRAEITEVAHNVDESGNLAVITAGRIPPNPSEVLGSNRMRDLIRNLSSHALVIIDSPPVLAATDAAVLTTGADGALIVVTSGRTTIDQLDQAVVNLSKANGRTLGVVMNRVPRRGAGAVYYGYQYQGTPAASAAPASAAPEAASRTAARR
ncbi:polysaccharide biosynthesis tyrosine autokinase [Microbacterium hominis]|uniref:non-specific protein-tyrosine kinase n=1 Tax=Microbacterium hominis TaxID=162426 RepID=A0A7D4UK39_9MICO|nr:polysaccharide biosynthesis tyrosine autokinase [Microbacterium hominis]QKJ20307.1 polysaccharide biosynthesis tyrosine autokinase [Microbacterium hominis]